MQDRTKDLLIATNDLRVDVVIDIRQSTIDLVPRSTVTGSFLHVTSGC